MFGLIGIAAAIIAAVKGHKTFAWVVGIWTFVACVLAYSGASNYAFAPGGIFLMIALTQKKVVPVDPNKEIAKYMVYCKKCGFVGSVESVFTEKLKCNKCNSILLSTGTPREDYAGKSDEEKQRLIEIWKNQTEDIPLASLPRYVDKPAKSTDKVTAINDDEAGLRFVCSYCGHRYSGWYKNCPGCGAVDTMLKADIAESIPAPAPSPAPAPAVSSGPVCPSCGKEIDDDSVFCSHCGAAIGEKHE